MKDNDSYKIIIIICAVFLIGALGYCFFYQQNTTKFNFYGIEFKVNPDDKDQGMEILKGITRELIELEERQRRQ